ncbi:phytanoyl-CoA dioxygenase family protein [Streptomyces sp. NPDC002122]|uniref:phytanoyl-CoA dioxygenase family protein n=1 Tax=Streptomyces sp. NPDC002122 TaxID=3154407 RepID=UPI00331B7507
MTSLPTSLRNTPLTSDEIARFHKDGYLHPNPVLTQDQIDMVLQAVDEHRAGLFESKTFELTDPVAIRRSQGEQGQDVFEYESNEGTVGHTFSFLFNMRLRDERIRDLAADPVIAGLARQLLDADEVVIMEDNVVVKEPGSKLLPFHQDYSYWPLATPDAVTVFIALDRITIDNGAMMVVPGSQNAGERLPVSFGEVESYMKDERPGVPEVPADPEAEGHPVSYIELQPGECSIHSSMVWHGSTPNTTPNRRQALILRYVKAGTIWLGNERFPYDEVQCAVGDPIGGPVFPVVPTAF